MTTRGTLIVMDPNAPIDQLPGIGKYYAYKLKRLEVKTLEDLIYHFPFRYDDFSQIREIGKVREVTPGEKLSIQGVVWQIKNIRTRRGKFVTVATVADQSDTIEVIWFNQPYLTKTVKAGTPISLSGKIEVDGHRLKMLSPSYEIIRKIGVIGDIREQKTLHTGRLVPVYPETTGLSSKWLRAKIAQILPQYLAIQKDFMPGDIIKHQKLASLADALSQIHFPQNYQQVAKAKLRLAFDELFLIQFQAALRKKSWRQKRTAPKMKIDVQKVGQFVQNLPFTLTFAQKRATKEILADMQKETPANRLLEGDVGSGKTVVAAAAAYVANLNGFEVLLAAPTEILTFQHQATLAQILSPYHIKVGIWTGSKKNRGDITCGTHALLSTFTPKKQVGLVVVDEQHRFGVAQRAKLFLDQSKKLTPHLLTMTATPIPRTLALTLYGDLDLSILDEMPKGRHKIATHVVPNFKRNDAYKFIEKQIIQGRQAFIITPFVEPSETMISVKAATEEFEKLKKIFSRPVIPEPFTSVILSPSIVTLSETKSLNLRVNSAKDLLPVQGKLRDRISRSYRAKTLQDDKKGAVTLGLLHGRLKSKEKEETINKFRANKINILVTTPVVEVGIDIPNATVMMIESAERFGLAQLHQLRGRVGRGEHQSYCLLFAGSRAPNSFKRLKSMEKIHVGAELAEIDLKMRGPGEIFGLKQSGFVSLKIADLSDSETIAKAQAQAKRLVEEDPKLAKYPLLRQKLSRLGSDLAQPN